MYWNQYKNCRLCLIHSHDTEMKVVKLCVFRVSLAARRADEPLDDSLSLRILKGRNPGSVPLFSRAGFARCNRPSGPNVGLECGRKFKAAIVLRREIVNGQYRDNLQSAVHMRKEVGPSFQVLVANFCFCAIGLDAEQHEIAPASEQAVGGYYHL